MHPRFDEPQHTKNAKSLAHAHASHLARSLFHVRWVFKPSRGIENATNPRDTNFLVLFRGEPRRCTLLGGELFARHLLPSRSLSRGWRDAPREEKKPHKQKRRNAFHETIAFDARLSLRARAFGASFFLNHRAARERENHPSAPEFCSPKEKKGYKKKASKSALASSDANARFQNKRRVVVRKTYHGARLHRDGFADEGGLLDVSGSEHFFCEFFA